MGHYIVWLNEMQAKDVVLVGQKSGNLAQMSSADLPVPTGFCVTVDAYQEHIAASDLWPGIQKRLDTAAAETPADLEGRTACIQEQVYRASVPAAVEQAIQAAAQELWQKLGDALTPLAVRPSATVVGQPLASFGGQHDAFLNVIGQESLSESIKKCWASLWTARAVLFREQNGLDHANARMAVAVQEQRM